MSQVNEQQDARPTPVVTVHVNAQPVSLNGLRQTGLAIKEAAISQGAKIKLDFVLYEEIAHDRTKHIKNDEVVGVDDQTRFLADEDTITIHVNRHPVKLEGHRHTGLQIKQAAMNQGVNIKLDFILLEEFGDGHTKPVADAETIEVNSHSKFDAIPDDDHS